MHPISPAIDFPHRIPQVGRLSRYWLLLLLLALSFAPTGNVLAQCFQDPSSPGSQGTVSFSPPSTIPVPANVPADTVLWTSATVTPSPSVVYDCRGTVNYGVKNNVGTTPGSGVEYYPTGVAGVSYALIHNGVPLYPYATSSESFGDGEKVTFSITTTLEIVATGTITNGSVLQAGTLGYWQWEGDDNPQIEAFVLANKVTFVSSSCSVVTNPIDVTLPTISTTALGSKGATAGATPFNISLSCTGAAGMSVSVQLDYNGTASGIQGVLMPTSGNSSGIGVQVLDQNNTPVTFGTPETEGTTPVGQMNIAYSASYYQTTSTITPGTLAASATFTITYQ
jgi:type 1 fimbria pilin